MVAQNELKNLISVARGEREADLLLKNARVVNTLTAEIEDGDVAIYKDKIAGVGDYDKAKEIVDLKGSYLVPGLIDGHVHVESSMLHPARYAQAVVPRGTLTVITDLHEIANVSGVKGIKFFLYWAKKLPLDMFFMAPSCVPASEKETSGARIAAKEIEELLSYPNVIGLGEVMSFPSVIRGNGEVLSKLLIARNKVIDGHVPRVSGKELNAYIASGAISDHESTALEEGREKLKRGMWLMIREGSSEKNLDTLLPLVNEKTFRRCFFVVDDRNCLDILRDGDVDAVVRKAISKGLEPIQVIQMATINPAEYFRLYDRGAIVPGYVANLITTKELFAFKIDMVFYHGKLVARGGKALFSFPKITSTLTNTIHVKSLSLKSLKLTSFAKNYPVIEIIPGQIITKKRFEEIKVVNGEVLPDVSRDILKLVVVERHKATGNVGVALVKGFGLKKGALASSIAHDSHNIVAVGTNDFDILRAVEEIKKLKGGLVVCSEGKVLASLPLPIAGLLSPEPLEKVVSKLEDVEKAASKLGNLPPSPFSILSFLALPVIPELRLTDRGLVEVS